MNNQKGLTLIELLAATTVLSIVGIIIWGVFIQGTNYSNQAMTKNQLTQEANIMIVRLKSEHQNGNRYKVIAKDCTIQINDETYDHPEICYSLKNKDDNEETNNPEVNDDFYPGKQDYPVMLTVKEKINPDNSVTINTYLSRLKEYGE